MSVDIVLGCPAKSQRALIRQLAEARLKSLPEVTQANVHVTSQIIPHAVQRGVKPIPGVKNIIAVASGKGGAGKSATAVNPAPALAQEGARAGLLDAGICGPSIPTLPGLSGRPESTGGKSLEPMQSYGVQAMSIGFLAGAGQPMVWRGPMVAQALEPLFRDTRWQDADYLVIDLPPGAGDIQQLALAQRIPVTGAVADTGRPTVAAAPDSRIAEVYRGIARKAAIRIADLSRDFSSRFPRIAIQNS